MKVKVLGLVLAVLLIASSFGFAGIQLNGLNLNGLDSQTQGLDFSTIGQQALKK